MTDHNVLRGCVAAVLLGINSSALLAMDDNGAVEMRYVEESASLSADESIKYQDAVPSILLEQRRNSGKQQAARAAYELGLRYAANKDWDKAGALIIEAIQLQPENTDYFHAAAQFAYEINNFKAARKFQLETIRLHQAQHGESNEQLVALMDELAMIYVGENHFMDAETLFKKTLQLREEMLEPNHPDIAVNLFWLATVKIRRGDLERAEQQLQQALDILKVAETNQDSAIAAVLHNLGELYRARKEFSKAEATLNQAIAMWRTDPEQNQYEILMTQKSLDALKATRLRLSDTRMQPGKIDDNSIQL